jgi:hypothetical protein
VVWHLVLDPILAIILYWKSAKNITKDFTPFEPDTDQMEKFALVYPIPSLPSNCIRKSANNITEDFTPFEPDTDQMEKFALVYPIPSLPSNCIEKSARNSSYNPGLYPI